MAVERNIKLTLAYDGSAFHGWQHQPGLRTVQGELEAVLRRVLGHPLHARGASRTDAGVHARGQVATVRTTTSIPIESMRLAVGHRFPSDMAVVHAVEVESAFDASRGAVRKLYRYRIHNAADRPVTADPTAVRSVWHVWYPLALDRLRAAAARLVGRHDFSGFATAGSPRQTTVRTIEHFSVRRRGLEVRLDVIGDGFLYNQVRNMVGTLVEIGRGHWPVERIDEILATCDRRRAGPTAPPQGLCLQWIDYDSGSASDQSEGDLLR